MLQAGRIENLEAFPSTTSGCLVGDNDGITPVLYVALGAARLLSGGNRLEVIVDGNRRRIGRYLKLREFYAGGSSYPAPVAVTPALV